MSSFTPVFIGGYQSGGVVTNKKPFLLTDQAFTELENAYVWRERVKKREGTKVVGRLQRIFTAINFFATGASPWTFNLLVRSGYVETTNTANPGQVTTTYPHGLTTGDKVIITGIVGALGYNNVTFTITVIDALNFTVGVNAASFGAYISGGYFISNSPWGALEPNAQLSPGRFSITFGGNTFTDNGLGSIVDGSMIVVGTINYVTGSITLTNTGGGGASTLLSFSYFPELPVMGILDEDTPTDGIEQTIYFDTKYAYIFVTNQFQELAPGTVWTGDFTQFFWHCNYQGSDSSIRLFFVTNDNINVGAGTSDPIRYFNSSSTTWTDLVPAVDASRFLQDALIVLPYYGRLIALNVWEGVTIGSSSNFFARCRFSQIGDPTAVDAWRSDIFGKGGLIDAPTNEAIISATFFRNTLIVFFEYTTWQLRYVGEYGLPFIWERISSDFGATSTFSSILFDQGVMTIGNRGIISASAGGVERIDEQIPETVYSFENQNDAPNFVHGVRDFQKEVVYWNYLSGPASSNAESFPDSILLLNYKNNTYAYFRDTVTCFGTAQFSDAVTWDSQSVSWDSLTVTWDNSDDQTFVPYVCSGNQQGFICIWENQEANTPLPAPSPSIYAQNLSISAINFSTSPTQVTIPNHNLYNGEFIYLTGALFTDGDPGINDKIYKVSLIDGNIITLLLYNPANGSYNAVSFTSTSVYIGGATVALLPVMNIVGKDFNPFQKDGKQFKLAHIDFQMDSTALIPSIPAVSVQLFVNSYLGAQANLVIGNQEVQNSAYTPGIITNAVVLSRVGTLNTIQITSADFSLPTGTPITIGGVLGMTELNVNYVLLTVVNKDNFTVQIDTGSPVGTYTEGGIFNAVTSPYYLPSTQYGWYRFYSTQFGQYLRVALTYDDLLMNQLSTHNTSMELNGMNCYFRVGGKIIF